MVTDIYNGLISARAGPTNACIGRGGDFCDLAYRKFTDTMKLSEESMPGRSKSGVTRSSRYRF